MGVKQIALRVVCNDQLNLRRPDRIAIGRARIDAALRAGAFRKGQPVFRRWYFRAAIIRTGQADDRREPVVCRFGQK